MFRQTGGEYALHLGPPIKPPRIDESGLQYRLYFLDGVGRITNSHEFYAENDAAAIKIAEGWRQPDYRRFNPFQTVELDPDSLSGGRSFDKFDLATNGRRVEHAHAKGMHSRATDTGFSVQAHSARATGFFQTNATHTRPF